MSRNADISLYPSAVYFGRARRDTGDVWMSRDKMAPSVMVYRLEMDQPYEVILLLSDDEDLDAASLALSVLSVRSFSGSDVPIWVLGSVERHARALAEMPAIGVRTMAFPEGVGDSQRVAHVAAHATREGAAPACVAIAGTRTLVWRDLLDVVCGRVDLASAVTTDAGAAEMAGRLMQRRMRLAFWPLQDASAAASLNSCGEIPLPFCALAAAGAAAAAAGGGDAFPPLVPPRSAASTRYYAVLLRGRPDREAAVARLRAALPNLTVVDAVDGAALGGPELRGLAHTHGFLQAPYVDTLVNGAGKDQRRLLVNSVAAFLSHRRAIKAAVDDAAAAEAQGRDAGAAVVFEDDVALRPEFLPVLDGVQDAVAGRPVDVVHLYVMPGQRAAFRRPTNPRYVLARTPAGLWGMQAYLLPDAAAAAKVLAGLWPMRGVVDEQITRIKDVDSFTLVGPPAVEELVDDAPSVTLGERRPRHVDEVILDA